MTQAPITTRFPTAGDAPADRTEFPCFNGYRAIAAGSVLLFHAGYAGFTTRDHAFGLSFFASRLDVGVAIFFLVSAFLLYRPFVVGHFARRAGPDVRSYCRRRLVRILPAYWAALTVIGFVFNAADVRSVRGSVVLYGLMQIYFPRWGIEGLGQAWSLCIELSFYAFLPIYAWLLGRTRRSPRRQLRVELTGVATLYLSSVVFRFYVATFFPKRVETKFWLLSTTDLFAVGMTLAVLSAWYAKRGSQPHWACHRALPAVSWALAAFAFWIVAIPLGLGRKAYGTTFPQELARQSLYGVVALFVLLPGVFGPQNRGGIRRLLQSRVAQSIGLVSYGLFLWHPWLINQLTTMLNAHVGADGWLRTSGGDIVPFPLMLAAIVVVSLTVAALSYIVVERPFLRLKRRRPTRRTA
jgi:peptidoglycan/LPS O-acetylase OafA/YrhL